MKILGPPFHFGFLKALGMTTQSKFQKQKSCSYKNKCAMIARFSTECQKVIDFASTTLHDWIKKSKTKTNGDSLALVFPRFVSPTCNRSLFPSYLVPLFQNESSFKTFHKKMSCDLHEN